MPPSPYILYTMIHGAPTPYDLYTVIHTGHHLPYIFHHVMNLINMTVYLFVITVPPYMMMIEPNTFFFFFVAIYFLFFLLRVSHIIETGLDSKRDENGKVLASVGLTDDDGI